MTKDDLLSNYAFLKSAYSLLNTLSLDNTQSTLVQLIAKNSRNDVAHVMMELKIDLDKRVK